MQLMHPPSELINFGLRLEVNPDFGWTITLAAVWWSWMAGADALSLRQVSLYNEWRSE